jgi:uncharacterized protein YycO
MFIPGEYTHGGVYVGNKRVVHAVARGVVSGTIIDFAMADRVIVLRPSRGQKKAVAQALAYVEHKVPYDYQMTEGEEALYCFELCAECYKDLAISKITPSFLNGLLTRKEPAWLADSFLKSTDFKVVFEYHPDKGIDTP